MIVTLPWPDKKLSPNARLHWRAKVGPKQAAKIAAGWATVSAKGFHALKERLAAHQGSIPLQMRFYPPDKRHRDDDNMIGSMKAARDAIAEALGVDDRRFHPHYFFEDACKPGRVEVDFSSFVGEKSTPVPLQGAAVAPHKESGPDKCSNTSSGPDHERTGDAP